MGAPTERSVRRDCPTICAKLKAEFDRLLSAWAGRRASLLAKPTETGRDRLKPPEGVFKLHVSPGLLTGLRACGQDPRHGLIQVGLQVLLQLVVVALAQFGQALDPVPDVLEPVADTVDLRCCHLCRGRVLDTLQGIAQVVAD